MEIPMNQMPQVTESTPTPQPSSRLLVSGSFTRSASLVLLGSVGMTTYQVALVIATAHLGKVVDVGDLSLGLVAAGPILAIGTFGLRLRQVRDVGFSVPPNRYWSARLFIVGLSALLTLPLVASYGLNGHGASIAVAMVSVRCLEALADGVWSVMIQSNATKQLAKLMILRASISGAIFCVVTLFTGDVLAGLIAVAIAGLLLLTAVERPAARVIERQAFALGLPSSTASLWSVCAHALPLGIASALVSLTLALPRYFLGDRRDVVAVGVFSAMVSVFAIVSLVTTAVGQVAIPRLSLAARGADSAPFWRLLRRLFVFGSSVGALSLIAGWFAGHEALSIVFGPSYASATVAFRWLLLALALMAAGTHLQDGLTVLDLKSVQVAGFGLGAAATLVMCATEVPTHGIAAAGESVFVGAAVQFGIFAGALLRVRYRRSYSSMRRGSVDGRGSIGEPSQTLVPQMADVGWAGSADLALTGQGMGSTTEEILGFLHPRSAERELRDKRPRQTSLLPTRHYGTPGWHTRQSPGVVANLKRHEERPISALRGPKGNGLSVATVEGVADNTRIWPRRVEVGPRPADYVIAAGLTATIAVAFVVLTPELSTWAVFPIAGCGVLVGVDAVRWARGRVRTFDPVGLIGVVGYHVFFLAPLLNVRWQQWVPDVVAPADWRPWLGRMAVIDFIGLIGYRAVLAWSVRRNVRASNAPARSRWVLDRTRFWRAIVLAVLAASIAETYGLARAGGLGGLEASVGATPGTSLQGLGWLLAIGESLPLLLLLAWAVPSSWAGKRPSTARVMLALAAFAVMQFAVSGLRGSRGNVIWTVAIGVGIVHVYVRPVRKRALVVMAIAGLSFMYLYGFYKAGGAQALSNITSSSGRAQVAQSSGRTVPFLLLEDLGRADLQAYELYKYDLPANGYQPAYGRTYSADLAQLVPGFIWPNRPPGKLKYGTDLVFGAGTYAAGQFHSESIYGAGGEALLNFGPASIPFSYIAVAGVVAVVRRRLGGIRLDDSRALFIPMGGILCVLLVTEDLGNVAFTALQYFLMPTLVVLAGSRRLGRRHVGRTLDGNASSSTEAVADRRSARPPVLAASPTIARSWTPR